MKSHSFMIPWRGICFIITEVLQELWLPTDVFLLLCFCFMEFGKGSSVFPSQHHHRLTLLHVSILYNHQVTILASWGAAHTVGMLKYFSIVGFVFFKSPSSQKQRLWPQTRERKRHSSSWLGICHHCRTINVSIFPCNFNKSDLTGCRIKLHFFPLLCHCNFWQNDSWSHQNKLRKIRPNPAAE